MTFFSISLPWVAVWAFFNVKVSEAAPTVTVPALGNLTGKYSSWWSKDVAMFLAIPFGKPPIGSLRWMPPQAYGAWNSPRDATKYGDRCVSGDDFKDGGGDAGASEDCLFLNVVTKSSWLGGPAKLPVLVWIYGGTYESGSAQQFTPETMVGAAKDPVVVVTINYRLNTFGFLGSKALAARSADGGRTGNYGLQDQRLALEWVRDHISAFGGRGADVTIFGESAGGNSILHHLIQPESFGLYTKAIIESGTYEGGYPMADAEALFAAILEKAGCGTDLDCFVNKTTKEIALATIEVAKTSGTPQQTLKELHWGPVVDGVSMTGTPQQLIPAGKFNTLVPVVMGSNRDEMNSLLQYLPAIKPAMTETDFDNLLAYLGNDTIKTVKKLYHPSVYAYPKDLRGNSQWWWAAMRIATDNGIPFKGFPLGTALGHCSARRIAEQLVRGGTPNVYLYNFARPLPFSLVGHGYEIPFVFDSTALAVTGFGNLKLSADMVAYWTRFADVGSPSVDKLPQWPSYAPDGDKANICLDATLLDSNISIEHGFRNAACDFWDKLAEGRVPAAREIIV